MANKRRRMPWSRSQWWYATAAADISHLSRQQSSSHHLVKIPPKAGGGPRGEVQAVLACAAASSSCKWSNSCCRSEDFPPGFNWGALAQGLGTPATRLQRAGGPGAGGVRDPMAWVALRDPMAGWRSRP
jgi:hypothetical protein